MADTVAASIDQSNGPESMIDSAALDRVSIQWP
jgi:hypothetical protein